MRFRHQCMMSRCYFSYDVGYNRYGGRGIKVCERWHIFENYLSDIESMGQIPEGFEIDRINNDGDYCLENVRFVSKKDNNNNKSTNILLTCNGVTKTLSQWADHTGLSYQTICKRYKLGKSVEQIVNEPNPEPMTLTLNGETKTIVEWSKALNIQAVTIRSRLRKGYSTEEALSVVDLVNPLSRQITLEGKTQSLRQWCIEKQVNWSTAKSRFDQGLPLEEVFKQETRVRKDSYQVEYLGRKQSLKDWCRELDLNYKTIWKRLKDGYSVEEALGNFVPKKATHPKAFRIEYQGKTQSLYAWCKELGLHHTSVERRFKKGLPLDEVFKKNLKA